MNGLGALPGTPCFIGDADFWGFCSPARKWLAPVAVEPIGVHDQLYKKRLWKVEPSCRRERGMAEREPAGEILSDAEPSGEGESKEPSDPGKTLSLLIFPARNPATSFLLQRPPVGRRPESTWPATETRFL